MPQVAPDEIDGQRQHRIAHVLADERERICREMQTGEDAGTAKFEDGPDNRHGGEQRQKTRLRPDPAGLLLRSLSPPAYRSNYALSAARPVCGNSPRGQPLNEKDQRNEDEDLREDGAGIGLEELVDNAHGHAADESAPQVADTAKDDHHDESMMYDWAEVGPPHW